MTRKTKVDRDRDLPEPRDRFDLRLEPELFTRIARQAKRLGLSMSAYIRLGITQRTEADEATDRD